MADRDAKKVERQLDRISAGLPSESAFLALAEKPVVALGPNSGRTAVDHRRSCRLRRCWDSGWCRLAPCCLRRTSPSSDGRERECIKWKSQRSRLPRDRHPKQWPRGVWKHALAQWAGKAYGLKNRCLVGKNARFRNPAETHLQTVSGDVRFGSLADMVRGSRDVRFTPKSGHAQRQHRCLLCANSRHYGSGGRRRDPPSRRKLGLKRLRVQGPGREARNETSSFRVYPSSRQKPDALALMGCAGDWIVMPEATKLSVSMIVSFSAFSPHCKLSDLTNSLSALSI